MLLFAFWQVSIYYMSTLNHITIEIFSIKKDMYTNKNTIHGKKLIW